MATSAASRKGRCLLSVPVLLLTFLVQSAARTGPVEPISSNSRKNGIGSESESEGSGEYWSDTLLRSDFPDQFVFGAATSAFQVEGAATEGGRGPSIWDTFSHLPGKIVDGSNGDIAVDQYHMYKEDIDRLASMGMQAYRFSISWPRLFPDGSGTINPEGVLHYNELIDYLISKGLQPFVTLYHWDLPQWLQDSVLGWLGPEIADYFAEYADACFREFGDRVKHWITFNEPALVSVNGYGTGSYAPGRTSNRMVSAAGDTATEPYLAGHNMLKSHAASVEIYRRKYQAKQGGVIGLTCDVEWGEPMTNSEQDKAAAQTHVEFQLGWFLDPIFFGDYPGVMRYHVGDRLPRFSKNESDLLRGSIDFVGMNHYTSRWVSAGTSPANSQKSDYTQDQWALVTAERDGVPIGDKAASDWLYIVPWGIQKAVSWVSNRYNNPPVYITENGMDDSNDPAVPLTEVLKDTKRVRYFHDYLTYLLATIRDGADVRGYFAWSLLDNFEWRQGYTKRFGLFFVDYNDGLKRYAKSSVQWFTTFLTDNREPSIEETNNHLGYQTL